MKKTIIVLFAAASCAMGVTLEDAAYTSTGSSITLDSPLASYSAILTLDVDALKNVMLVGKPLSKHILVNFIDNDNGDIGLQTNYTSANSAIAYSGLYGCWNNSGAYSFGMDAAADGSGMQKTDFWANAVGASAALMYTNGTGTTGLITISYSDGTTTTLGGTLAGGLKGSSVAADVVEFDTDIVTNAWVYSSGLSVNDAKTLTIAAIPEPTTATLSLLALAGLAARRRRK